LRLMIDYIPSLSLFLLRSSILGIHEILKVGLMCMLFGDANVRQRLNIVLPFETLNSVSHRATRRQLMHMDYLAIRLDASEEMVYMLRL
jgi:hypothetical protein